ncbi:MAG: DUF4178 domain-containing protein [Anaerolineae bacterium]|nr:DUF4178 domain-containing protein [Anaerolineae bacterium]
MDEQQINETLQKGIRAARRGRPEPAQHFLSQVIQVDPNNEEAWLWLSRVVEDPLQRTECLQKVLAINPNNHWAAEQLAELQAAAPTPAAETPQPAAEERKYKRLQPKSGEIKLELLQCPHCGGNLDLRGGADIKTLVCSYCSSVLDLTSEQAAVIGQSEKRVRPMMPIEPGMEATFKDEVHQVIGWIRYEGWDDEDRWRWDEWLLVSAAGQYRWLSYDPEEGFILNEKIQPLAPFDPRTASSIQVPGGAARVTERAPARIIALKGELTWQCKIGDQLAYFDARRGSVAYSVEYTQDEVELYQGQPLTDVEVWTAFGRQDLMKKAGETAVWNRAFAILAAFSVLLVIFSCLGAVFTGFTGELVTEEQFQLVKSEEQFQTIGPINLTQAGKVHQIQLQAGSLPVNTWAVVEVSARDSDENEYYLFSGEFWDEEGRDSDGYWHENDLNADYVFKLENPGEYYLDLSMAEATVDSLSVSVKIYQGVWLARYFIIYLVIITVLVFVFFGLSNRRLVGSALVKSK